MDAGVSLRETTRGDHVVMYETNINSIPVGSFQGKVVVTMRPLVPTQAIKAVQVTTRYPFVHGAPIHIGLPEPIGIEGIEVWTSCLGTSRLSRVSRRWRSAAIWTGFNEPA